MPLQTIRWKPALVATLLVAIVALGVLVRWEEPASSPVIPAEDPYTHMALVRSHLSDGELDPLVEGGELYPPGMHAVLAAVYAFTGADLADIFRFAPVYFGAIGIIGIGALLWRNAGPTAAVVGSLGMALAPELAFRTTMMAPTAIDLALLPFLLFATLELMRGRLGWSIPLAATIIFLIVSHPWVLIILGPVMLGTVLVASVLGHRDGPPLIRPFGAALALAAIGAALLASITICWNECGLGFQNIGESSSRLDRGAMLVAVLALAIAAAYALAGRKGRGATRPIPIGVRLALSGAAVVALIAVSVPAFRAGMPEHVDLMRMFGWPLLMLAAVGLAAVPLLRWPAGWVGVAMCVVTYPFVIYNPLESPFWPHRTAAYLGIGLVILAGVGAAAIVLLARRLAVRVGTSSQRTSQGAKLSIGTALALTAFLFTAGSVYASTPPTYETGWYRLYQECEFDAIRDLAENSDEQTVIMTGDWRTKLVAAAFADDAARVWYSESFFLSEHSRNETTVGLALDGRNLIVIEDRHMTTEHPEYDTSFLQSDDWRLQSSHCSEGLGRARLSVYVSEVEP